MDINGLLAALAATGDKLNAAEVAVAQLRAENQQLREQLEAVAADVKGSPEDPAAPLSEPQEPQPAAGDAAAPDALPAVP